MYEYEVQTIYGVALPTVMIAPRPGFRYRDAKFTQSTSNTSNSISFGGPNGTPYVQNSMESHTGQWTIIWERYVPQKEEGNL